MIPDPRIGVPIPAYLGRSLGNLTSSVWAALSSGREGDAPPLRPLDRDLDPFRGGRPKGPVVVLLLDGLGWTAFLESAERTPGGRLRVGRGTPGRSRRCSRPRPPWL